MQITFPTVNGSGAIYLDVINALCGHERKSMLDCGCNKAPYTSQLGFKERLYIDVLERTLDNPGEQQFFKQMDCMNVLNLGRYFQTVISSDHIEHMKMKDGFTFLNRIKRISDRQILFTPLDWWMRAAEDNTDPEAHHSLWRPENLSTEWFSVVFPVYHPTLNIGAWFSLRCENLEQEFDRVCAELETKLWAKEMEVAE